jgi:DNA-binding CsgD family transcriptional regulator
MAPFATLVAIFVQDRSTCPPCLARLSPGELRILLALTQRRGANEAADMLGIGEPTVRTHLQGIFSKTGTSRQTELLQLLQ